MRVQLSELLPEPLLTVVTLPPASTDISLCAEPMFPEYETQDQVYCDPESSDDEDTGADDIVELDELAVGEIVEVYWEGEDEWYEGQVMNIDLGERQFEILYKADSQRLYHREEDYPVRYS